MGVAIDLLTWQSNPNQYKFDWFLDLGSGVKSSLYSWNSGDGFFLCAPSAGGTSYNVQNSASDKWVYIGVGCDFSNRVFMTSARDINGAILNSNIYFAPTEGQSNSVASWDAMRGFFAAGFPSSVSIGNTNVQIQAIKISNIYRTNLFAASPSVAVASSTVFTPETIAPARASNRTVSRSMGYDKDNTITLNVTESYLELTNGSQPISFLMTNLPIGFYTLYIKGTVDALGRTSLPVVWRPCPISFRVWDASSNLLATGKMLYKQGLSPRTAQAFSFHLDHNTANVVAELSIDTNTIEYAQIMSVTLFDPISPQSHICNPHK